MNITNLTIWSEIPIANLKNISRINEGIYQYLYIIGAISPVDAMLILMWRAFMSLVLYTNVYHAFFQISNGNIYVHVYINRGPGTFIAITAWGCAERSYLSVGRWRIHESANQPVINADNGLSTAQRQAMFSPDAVLLVHVHALTHWDRVAHLCVSKKNPLSRKWLVASSAQIHYLDTCWSIVSSKLRNLREIYVKS